MYHYFLTFCFFILSISLVNGQTCQCEGCPIDIPDLSTTEIPYEVDGAEFNNIGVSNEICRVKVKFKHDYVGDLTIYLKSPSGDSIRLVGGVEECCNTSFTLFDVSFVPCSVVPKPDPGKSGKWDNNDGWGWGLFTGTYIPNDPAICFEDFSGSVNGTWNLIVKDNDNLYDGELVNFSILFCNMTGIDCCTPDAGDLSSYENISTCIGESMLFDFTPVYPLSPPNEEYIYKNVVTQNGLIIDIMNDIDLSNYPVGNYTVCGLSIFEGDTVNLPATDGTILLLDVVNSLSSLTPLFCGDFSLDCVDIEILPKIDVTSIEEEICLGDFFFFDGRSLIEEGIYYDTLASVKSCDSIVELTLVINPLDLTLVDETTCIEMNAGIDTTIFKNTNQCDSIVILTTIFTESNIVEIFKKTCNVDSVKIDTLFLENQYRCDSLVITTTTLFPISHPSITNKTACNESDAGMDTIVFMNQYGCDSLEIIATHFVEGNITQLDKKTCAIDSIGLDTVVLKNQFDCDSLIITDWTLFPITIPTEIFETSCFELDEGRDTSFLRNSNDCDSLVIVITTFTPPSDTTFINNGTCNPADVGLVIEILNDQNTCDSVISITTFLFPKDTTWIDLTTCDTTLVGIDTLAFDDQNFCDSLVITTTAWLPFSTFDFYTGSCNPLDTGVFEVILENQFGCDSFLTKHVELWEEDLTEIFLTVCDIPDHENTIDTLDGILCDSIIITHYLYKPPFSIEKDTTSCDTLLVGVEKDTLYNNVGCDSIYLTVNTSLISADTTYGSYETCNPLDGPFITIKQGEICDEVIIDLPILFFGDTIRLDSIVCSEDQVGTLIDTFRNEYGCLSRYFTELTYMKPDTTFLRDSSCNPVNEGTIFFSYPRIGMCDSIVSLTTFLLPTEYTDADKITCDPSDVGIKLDTLENRFGCDSFVTYHITLVEQIIINERYTSCNVLDTGHFESILLGEICDTIKIVDVLYEPLDTVLSVSETCLFSSVKDTFEHKLSFQGCDSVTHVIVEYLPNDTTFLTTFNCEKNDTTIESYVRNGCDSVVVTYSSYKEEGMTYIYDSTCVLLDTGSFLKVLPGEYDCDSFVYTVISWIVPDTTFIDSMSCNPLDTGIQVLSIGANDGCDSIVVINTTYIDAWSLDLEIQNVSCFDGSDGFISIVVPEDVTIIWGNGTTVSIREDLVPGDYDVTITGDNCTIEETFTIENIDPLSNTFLTREGLCLKEGGLIEARPIGGNPPYFYSWSNGEPTKSIDSLESGAYEVTITDINGCTTIDNVSIEISRLILETVSQSISCYGYDDGWIEINIIEGMAPFIYQWSNKEMTARIENLAPGFYQVIVTDALGCEATTSYEIREPDELSISFATEPATNGNNGAITALVSGGTTPYNYLWNTGETSLIISDLATGNYAVTVTDKNGCEMVESKNVTTKNDDLFDKLEILIYPNPTHDIFYIDLGQEINVDISIFSIDGKLVYHTIKSDRLLKVNCHKESFYSGTYYVLIKSDKGSRLGKINYIK